MDPTPNTPSVAGTPPTTPPAGGTPPAASWRDGVAQEFRDHASIKDYPDLNALVKSHVHLQSKLGANPIVRPKDDAKPEEWGAFYDSLGRPKAPADYKLPNVQLPQGFPEDKTFKESMLKTFHDAGLTDKQASKLFEEYSKYGGEKFQAFQQQQALKKQEAIQGLQKKWGDKFDTNMVKAEAVIRTFGSPQLVEWLNETGFKNDAAFVELFYNIGQSLLEDSASGQGAGQLGDKIGDAALPDLKALKESTEFQKQLQDPQDPKHMEAVAKWQEVHKRIAQGKGGNNFVKPI